MKESRNILTILLLVLTLTSCSEERQKYEKKSAKPNEVKSADLRHKLLVDYKKDTYKISVGDSFKASGKTIDWRWAALSDSDDKLDSTGKDSFLFLGEPLIKYNNGEWLPKLQIETDKNIITSFTCSILFDLADTTNAETTFLSILSKDIKQLQKNEVIKSLTDKGIYEVKTQGFSEAFRLTKGKGYAYDRFDYSVKRR